MKCVICHGDDIKEKEVLEEIKNENDIIFVPIRIPVCMNCGERYYNRVVMQMLEKIEDETNNKSENLKEIGKVLIYEKKS